MSAGVVVLAIHRGDQALQEAVDAQGPVPTAFAAAAVGAAECGALGLVEAGVGNGEELLPAGAIVGEDGEAPGYVDGNRLSTGRLEGVGGEPVLKGLRKGVGFLARVAREDDDELVAAEATNDAHLIGHQFELVGYDLEDAIAGGVTEGIVEILEVVNVHQEHGKAAPAVALSGDETLQVGLHEAVVEQAGDEVRVGPLAELFVVAGALKRAGELSG